MELHSPKERKESEFDSPANDPNITRKSGRHKRQDPPLSDRACASMTPRI